MTDRQNSGRIGGVLSLNVRFYVLAAFLTLVFLTGGGARGDIASLMAIRPMAVLVLGFGLLALSRKDVRKFWPLFVVGGFALLIAGLQLVPLPPSIWQALPGRDLIANIDGLLGLEGQWRPLTLDPSATRNALFALIVPLAVLVLAVQMGAKEHRKILLLMLILGGIFAAFAALQIVGDGRSALYFYRITNFGKAVGLFANANHQAVFMACLVPMLFAWALQSGTKEKGREKGGANNRQWAVIIAVLASLVIVPLVFMTGSRAGLLALFLAFALTLFAGALHLRNRQADHQGNSRGKSRANPRGRGSALNGNSWKLLAGGALAAIIAMFGLSAILGRNSALDQLLASNFSESLRGEVYPLVLDIAVNQLPWGTGLGSFDSVFRMNEPDSMLGASYVNHAHNDFLEIAMTGGIPALVLLAFALIAFAVAAFRLSGKFWAKEDINFLSVAGVICMLLLTLGSLVDYPLRAPSLSCFFVLLAVWAGHGLNREKHGSDLP